MSVQPYRSGFSATFLAVLLKELKDAFRDKRSVQLVLMLSLVQAPLILFMLSTIIGKQESKVSQREVYVQGIFAAPTLRNYLERQGYEIKAPEADAESKIRAGELDRAVLTVSPEFESQLLLGEEAELEILYNSSNRGSETAQGVLKGLAQGFNRERAALGLAMRGVSAQSLQVVDIQERDLASASSRAAKLTGAFIPLYVLIALISGALNVAMDTSAGERERSSLEPLMMNPASPWAIALGKWLAVMAFALLVAALTSLSYVPAQMLLKSEALQALFHFSWAEALQFALICLPFAAVVSALMMAASIRGKSIKEAQAGSSVVMMVFMLLPLVSLFSDAGEPVAFLFVPSLSQQTLMMRVLRGEEFTWMHWVWPSVVCFALAAVALFYVSRALRRNAVK
jgi:sodium transport system permease protein